MTAINHILLGATIGSMLPPAIAIPVAITSHFLLDALPHYGIKTLVDRRSDPVWKIDAALIIVFVIYFIFFAHIDRAFWVAIGSFAAVSPDFAWIYRFAVVERFGSIAPKPSENWLNKFHANIQKYESPKRWWIEILVFISFLGIVLNIVI